MMNMKKTAIAVAIVSSMGVAGAAQALTHNIDTLVVTSGSFGMGFFTQSGFIPVSDFGGQDLLSGYVAPGWDTNVAQTGHATNSIAAFNFGAAWVNTYTAATATQASIPGGGPVPTCMGDDVSGGALMCDMSSFFANWNGTDFNQGNANVAGTLDGAGNFTMEWTSLIGGGPPFGGETGSWAFSGTYTASLKEVEPPPTPEPIPVPAAAWLMGSGLLGLVGVARRRRKSA